MGIVKTTNVQLRDKNKSRGIHTQYTPDHSSGKSEDGNARRFQTQSFLKGKGRDVETQKAQQLRDSGIVR